MDFNPPPPGGGGRRSLTEGEDRGRSMQARLLPTWAAVQAPKRAPRAICQECNRAKVSGIYPLAHRLPPPPSPSAPPPPGGGGFYGRHRQIADHRRVCIRHNPLCIGRGCCREQGWPPRGGPAPRSSEPASVRGCASASRGGRPCSPCRRRMTMVLILSGLGACQAVICATKSR